MIERTNWKKGKREASVHDPSGQNGSKGGKTAFLVGKPEENKRNT